MVLWYSNEGIFCLFVLFIWKYNCAFLLQKQGYKMAVQ